MSSIAWQIIAENRIREAFERGEFDDLPGAGKPLDLSDYFNTPAADRMAFSILKSAGALPQGATWNCLAALAEFPSASVAMTVTL